QTRLVSEWSSDVCSSDLKRNPSWSPYPWQVRFAQRWATPDEEPPSWVIAPTGAGKTLAIDALVWALAQQAELPPGERTVPTRIRSEERRVGEGGRARGAR